MGQILYANSNGAVYPQKNDALKDQPGMDIIYDEVTADVYDIIKQKLYEENKRDVMNEIITTEDQQK